MSYSEQDGKVVLNMSREDYDALLIRLGISAAWMAKSEPESMKRSLELINRLNEGNPNFTPYQVG